MTILAALLASCSDAQQGSAPASALRDSVVRAVEGLDTLPFRRLPSLVPEERVHRERGVGVVFPAGFEEDTVPRADTLLVRQGPDASWPTVARLIRSAGGEYVLEVRTDVREGGALEHGYEDVGLPLMDLPTGSPAPEWLRVHYGTGSRGEPFEGWVWKDSPRVGVLVWSERLPASPLFFLDPDSAHFHSAPDGPRVSIELTPADSPERFDYIMYSLETRGHWMRVEVVTPKDYCFDPPAPRRDTVWVRYLDESSEPRVWYYTRGC